MRVLALGALDVPYIRDNWADAIRHVLADDVTWVNVTPWLACAPPEAHLKYVYRLLATGAYDYLFVYHDYIFSDFPDEFFAHVRSAGLRTIAYHPDDEPEVWYQRNRAFDGRYDLVASHARRGVERRIAEGRPTRALYVPWGFNQRFFQPPNTPPTHRYDVVFVGKYKVHDHDSTLFREDGRWRDEALETVAALCERRGWRFALFGHGWERHPTLARCAGGLLSHEQMVAAYQSARIVLNPGWTADEGVPAPQTKLRHFEVPGCGAFQLTNRNPELGELLRPGEDVVFYDDNAELCDQIAYYLSHEEERRAIAESATTRVHEAHTLDARARTLFGHVTALWPPRRSASCPRAVPRVTTVQLRGVEEVRALRERLQGPSPFGLADAVHVIACDGTVAATNYAGLRDWWRAGAPVLAGRSFYQVPDSARNPLQPQRSEVAGGFLGERVALDTLPSWHRDAVPTRLGSIVDGERAHFLLNYIVRPHVLPALLDAFCAGDVRALDAMSPLDTGLVFSEVQIALPPPPEAKDGRVAPAYVGPLRAVLRQAAALDQGVAIYGARGDMAETVFDIVQSTANVRLVGLFDRALAGREVAGFPVLSPFELPVVAPDVLLIAAAYSGPAIYEQLKPLEPRMALVPLYDLNAPAWTVLIS